MGKVLILLSALLAMGCAITSGYHSGPNGRPVHYIDGMSAGTAMPFWASQNKYRCWTT